MKKEFLTQHGPLKRRIAELKKFKGKNINIHITGESGVGKEVVARMIHELELDPARPFVPINSAGIPPTLVESVLFGHEKGSFSGAIAQYKGKFEQANGGDLFLDEISELSTEIQAKLLRVLQDHEIDRIGSDRVIKSYFRLISASNRNLRELVHEGRFREDLFYRVNMYEIEIPALRERKNDIPLLAKHFIDVYAETAETTIESDAIEKLIDYSWPGNVRELESVIKLAVVMSGGRVIGKEHIQFHGVRKSIDTTANQVQACGGILECSPSEGQTHGSAATSTTIQFGVSPYDQLVMSYERQLIEKLLIKNNWHRNKTAKELGISRNRLYKKMQLLGIG